MTECDGREGGEGTPKQGALIYLFIIYLFIIIVTRTTYNQDSVVWGGTGLNGFFIIIEKNI